LALQGVESLAQKVRGDLGITVAPNESESLEDLEIRPGVRIIAVAENSPASRGGCQVGDVLLAINQDRIDAPEALDVWLQSVRQPQQCELQLERGSRVFQSSVNLKVIDHGAQQQTLYYVDRVLTRSAWLDSPRGPVLFRMGTDSPLKSSKLKLGDIVRGVNGQELGLTAQHLVRYLRGELSPGDKFELQVLRGEERLSVSCQAWSPGRRLTAHSFWPLWTWEYNPEIDSEFLMLGDLILFSLFKRERLGEEVETTVLTFFSWKSGEATLESISQ